MSRRWTKAQDAAWEKIRALEEANGIPLSGGNVSIEERDDRQKALRESLPEYAAAWDGWHVACRDRRAKEAKRAASQGKHAREIHNIFMAFGDQMTPEQQLSLQTVYGLLFHVKPNPVLRAERNAKKEPWKWNGPYSTRRSA